MRSSKWYRSSYGGACYGCCHRGFGYSGWECGLVRIYCRFYYLWHTVYGNLHRYCDWL